VYVQTIIQTIIQLLLVPQYSVSSIFTYIYIYIYYRIICYTSHIYKYLIICGDRGLPCGLYNLYNSGNSGCQTMFVIGQRDDV
jgi:hypothetical protein